MSDNSAVKLKPFSGKDEDWVFWSPQFLAHAEAKHYRAIAEGEEVPPNDLDILDPVADATQIKLRQANK
eukprot:scaffold42243_cov168-Amphora_coffeaeformis.AAC.3